jgi:hypothetical protein
MSVLNTNFFRRIISRGTWRKNKQQTALKLVFTSYRPSYDGKMKVMACMGNQETKYNLGKIPWKTKA